MNQRLLAIAEWSAIAGVGATGMFNAFTPTPYEIRHELLVGADADIDERLCDLRSTYLKALGLSAILGIGASLIVQSPVPGLVAAVASGAMIVSYETAIPADRRLLAEIFQPRNYIEAEYRVLDQ